MKERKWVDEVVDALKKLGGVASYPELYDYIRKNTKKSFSKNWKASIRGTIERHSSDSKVFEGKMDLFYSVKGIGKGIWGLRENLVKTPVPEDLGIFEDKTKFPEKTKVEVYRVLRDTVLSKTLKQLYKNKCQICGKSITLKENKMYSEAHHIKPLGKHNGPDKADNIIILCPNHHVEFDYGVIAIDSETLRVLHKDEHNKFKGKKVFFHPKHNVNKEFLTYHLNKIFNGD